MIVAYLPLLLHATTLCHGEDPVGVSAEFDVKSPPDSSRQLQRRPYYEIDNIVRIIENRPTSSPHSLACE